MSSAPSSRIPYFLLSALAVASDQFSKPAVLESFRFMEWLDIVPDFFGLTPVYNTGATFSFLAGQGDWQKFFFLVLAVVVSLYLARAIWYDDFRRQGKIGAAMIIGGAVGNVIDRLLYGHVADLLLFYWQDRFYPAFNIADSFVCVGAVLLAVDGLRNRKPPENGNKEKQQTESHAISEKTIILADLRGFCVGVDQVISTMKRALKEFDASIYARYEVVHNKFVVDNLREKGTIFIENLSEMPAGVTLIYSAYGVSKAVQEEAKARGFRVFDATCPLVTKIHKEVARLDAQDCEIIVIGHKDHVEVEGTMGQLPPGKMFLVEAVEDVARLEVRNPDKLAYVSQTTLSVGETKDIVAALDARFPNIRNPHKEGICCAITNRQKTVKELAGECDLVIVAGSPNSSNSNRLCKVAALRGVDAYMVDNAGYPRCEWFEGKNKVDVATGASVPEVLVKGVLQTTQGWGHETIREGEDAEEGIASVLSKELRREGENKQALNKG